MHSFYPMSASAGSTISHLWTLLAPAFLARTSAPLANALDSAESRQVSSSKSFELQKSSSPNGWSLKTSSGFSLPTQDGISRSFSHRWPRSGILWRTGFSTVNSSEWPNDDAACSLLEVLEKEAPQRFYLSPKAAAGIIRRAKSWRKRLSEPIRRDLQRTASFPALSLRAQTSSSRHSPIRSSDNRSTAHPLILRRLTPTECEMLQGFPKGWTVPDTAHWATPLRSE